MNKVEVRLMWTEGTAERLARAVHAGATDHAGVSYIEHVADVARRTGGLGGHAAQRMAAWLHDVVEDSDLTLEDLRTFGCPETIVTLVDALTFRKGETRAAYYQRIVETPDAVLVKEADIGSNTDPERMALLTPEKRGYLTEKYIKARAALGLEKT